LWGKIKRKGGKKGWGDGERKEKQRKIIKWIRKLINGEEIKKKENLIPTLTWGGKKYNRKKGEGGGIKNIIIFLGKTPLCAFLFQLCMERKIQKNGNKFPH